MMMLSPPALIWTGVGSGSSFNQGWTLAGALVAGGAHLWRGCPRGRSWSPAVEPALRVPDSSRAGRAPGSLGACARTFRITGAMDPSAADSRPPTPSTAQKKILYFRQKVCVGGVGVRGNHPEISWGKFPNWKGYIVQVRL
jgi:hypothetical protein